MNPSKYLPIRVAGSQTGVLPAKKCQHVTYTPISFAPETGVMIGGASACNYAANPGSLYCWLHQIGPVRVIAGWSRFGTSFYCLKCGSRMNEAAGRNLIHPTHTAGVFGMRNKAIECAFVGKIFADPFADIELKEVKRIEPPLEGKA